MCIKCSLPTPGCYIVQLLNEPSALSLIRAHCSAPIRFSVVGDWVRVMSLRWVTPVAEPQKCVWDENLHLTSAPESANARRVCPPQTSWAACCW